MHASQAHHGATTGSTPPYLEPAVSWANEPTAALRDDDRVWAVGETWDVPPQPAFGSPPVARRDWSGAVAVGIGATMIAGMLGLGAITGVASVVALALLDTGAPLPGIASVTEAFGAREAAPPSEPRAAATGATLTSAPEPASAPRPARATPRRSPRRAPASPEPASPAIASTPSGALPSAVIGPAPAPTPTPLPPLEAAPPSPSPMVAPPPNSPAPAPVVGPPAPVAATTRFVPAPATAAPPPTRNTGGRVVVLEDGAPPVDPVHVNVATDLPVNVTIDGQYIGVTPLDLVIESGTHEVVLRTDDLEGVYSLEAWNGERWCFSARGRKGFRAVNCR